MKASSSVSPTPLQCCPLGVADIGQKAEGSWSFQIRTATARCGPGSMRKNISNSRWFLGCCEIWLRRLWWTNVWWHDAWLFWALRWCTRKLQWLWVDHGWSLAWYREPCASTCTKYKNRKLHYKETTRCSMEGTPMIRNNKPVACGEKLKVIVLRST